MRLQQTKKIEPGPDVKIVTTLPGRPINVTLRGETRIYFTWIDRSHDSADPHSTEPSHWDVVGFTTGEEISTFWVYVGSIAIPGDRLRHFFTKKAS